MPHLGRKRAQLSTTFAVLQRLIGVIQKHVKQLGVLVMVAFGWFPNERFTCIAQAFLCISMVSLDTVSDICMVFECVQFRFPSCLLSYLLTPFPKPTAPVFRREERKGGKTKEEEKSFWGVYSGQVQGEQDRNETVCDKNFPFSF